ncbi:PspA/IM30 family protein [Streptomyces sp. TLI_146]|uniref:PspA/IM30 family protein n=1 Tax=Streptomyces sp. TLI_146 TaxID=1938858 RepID=UPI000C70BD6C|nr:PspA/IM30 family protein [Streptomyces sp. TLI_146]PKV87624.1 phage shock protein A (PspA) family protein [Streptomyces sp. TLI_146]
MNDRQSVLGRVGRLAKANVNALLDQAEDPQKMLDELIREYTGNIAEAEQAAASAVGDVRLMELDRVEDLAAAKAWGDQAVAASRKADGLRAGGFADEADRFDRLAKVALGRQVQSESEARAAEPVIAAQVEVVEKLKSGLARMKSQLDVLRAEQGELASRADSAGSRLPDGLKSVDLLDPAGEIPRFEDKLRREEARARGGQELAASSLDAQFEHLDAPGDTAEVEARLAALKATT